MRMLMAVRDIGETTIKDLAFSLGVSSPSASCMVDRLVDAGLLTREQSKVDRREVCVAVSLDCLSFLDGFEAALLDSIIDVLEKIGPEYSRQWCDVYTRIKQVLDAES